MPVDYIFYIVSIFIINAFYIAVYLGIFVSVPEYIVIWYTFIQVFLCLILMYRYNPFREKSVFTENDGRLIFGACCILLNNVISIPFILKFIDPLKSIVLKTKVLNFIMSSEES